MLRIFFLLVMCISLSACVVIPRKVQYFDENCQVFSKKVVVEPSDVDALACHASPYPERCYINELNLAAVSLVVTGTLVVAGNTIYWLERQANCKTVKPEYKSSAKEIKESIVKDSAKN